MDWSATPLGPRQNWPQSLRTTVNMFLATRFPMCLLWGDELIQIYNEGCQIIAAGKHPQALIQVPEVALIDIGMPGMDGYEVARRLRQSPELKHTALVAITGYGHDEDIQKSRDAGFHDHLVKPVDMETLNPFRQLRGAWVHGSGSGVSVNLIFTHPPDGASSRTSLRPRPRSHPNEPSCVVSFVRRFRTAHFSTDRRSEFCQPVQPSDHRCASAASGYTRALPICAKVARHLMRAATVIERTRARDIFILRCGTKDHVLLVPQSHHRINSGRSPCRRIASENRGAQEDDTGQHQDSRIIGLGLE